MGASIFTRARSTKLRKSMLAFLGKEYLSWKAVAGDLASPYMSCVLEGNGREIFDYYTPLSIGTEYAARLDGWERVYIYSLIRWVALKVGQRRSTYSKETVEPNVFPEPVPYMNYDGCENWPILVMSERDAMKLPPKQRWCAVDRFGVYLSERTSESLVTACYDTLLFNKKTRKLFEEDLKKLGERPESSKGCEIWRDAYLATKARHAAPEIKKMLPVVRGALQRLDDAWGKHGL